MEFWGRFISRKRPDSSDDDSSDAEFGNYLFTSFDDENDSPCSIVQTCDLDSDKKLRTGLHFLCCFSRVLRVRCRLAVRWTEVIRVNGKSLARNRSRVIGRVLQECCRGECLLGFRGFTTNVDEACALTACATLFVPCQSPILRRYAPQAEARADFN
jgi:hypothetical protein